MDLNELHEFITAIWLFLKNNSGLPVDWRKAVKDAEALHDKYGAEHTRHEMILDAIEILREADNKYEKHTNRLK